MRWLALVGILTIGGFGCAGWEVRATDIGRAMDKGTKAAADAAVRQCMADRENPCARKATAEAVRRQAVKGAAALGQFLKAYRATKAACAVYGVEIP